MEAFDGQLELNAVSGIKMNKSTEEADYREHVSMEGMFKHSISQAESPRLSSRPTPHSPEVHVQIAQLGKRLQNLPT